MIRIWALTRKVGHRIQLLRPVIGDLDGFLLHSLTFSGHPLLIGVDHDLRQVVRMQSVEDIEEIISGRPFSFRINIRKIGHHCRILAKLRIESLHREFIVMRHLDHCHLGLLQQLFLAGQYCLEEVLIHDGLVRQVELEADDKQMS